MGHGVATLCRYLRTGLRLGYFPWFLPGKYYFAAWCGSCFWALDFSHFLFLGDSRNYSTWHSSRPSTLSFHPGYPLLPSARPPSCPPQLAASTTRKADWRSHDQTGYNHDAAEDCVDGYATFLSAPCGDVRMCTCICICYFFFAPATRAVGRGAVYSAYVHV